MTDSITIVHAGDIHLDSPLRGLERLGDAALASRLRLATRVAFGNLIERTVATRADALVLAGDIYDGDWKDYATGRFFVQQMAILRDAGVPVFLAAGNHDAQSVITKSLRLPDNVHVMRTDRPETVIREDLGVAFHGQGFADRAVHLNLARGYPEPVAHLVNVGILHTSVSGYEGHEPYAPCTVDDLQSKGYEYFALGHVHTRVVLCEGRTTAAFSGNLQGRHVKETGPKGAYWVTLRAGESASLRFEALDVARWENLRLDISPAQDLDEVLEMVSAALRDARVVAEDRPLVARLTLEGETPSASQLADRLRVENEIEIVAQDIDVALERIRFKVRPPDAAITLPRRYLEGLRASAESSAFSQKSLDALWGKMNAETAPHLRRLGLLENVDCEEVVRDALDALLARVGDAR
jgi:DNA repair exonuclease SbcCD nuclease subunit